MDASEVWNAVLDKAAVAGTASLSAREKVIYHLNRFAIDLETGGLTGLLYNMSPTANESGWSQLHETIEALDAAGESEASGVLRKVAEAIESAPAGASSSWGQFIRPVEARLQELEPELERAASRVWDRLDVLAEELVKHE